MSNREITPGNNPPLPQEQPTSNEHDTPREIIKLGDEFQLFPPSRTEPLWGNPEEGLTTKIGIIAEDGDTPIPFDIRLMKIDPGLSKMQFITPLEPSAGYEFSDEDLDPVQRIGKYEALRQQPSDPTQAAFDLSVDSRSEYFSNLGLSKKELDPEMTHLPFPKEALMSYEFKPKVLDRLRALRFQVTFPTGQAYEGQPSELGILQGRIVIKKFHWLDSPPPVPCADWDMTNELVADRLWPSIAVPNTESMQGVKGRFFFAETNELGTENTDPLPRKNEQTDHVDKQKDIKRKPAKESRWQRLRQYLNEESTE